MKTVSVSSSVSADGSSPEESRAWLTVSRNVPDLIWSGETLTAISHGAPCNLFRFQALAWRQASSITHSPIGTMSPVRSAVGMNSSGGTMPRTGSFQRINASVPANRPRRRSTIGW